MKISIGNKIALLLTVAGLFFLSNSAYAQCSMCRAVVESNDANVGQGLNNGILYLMGFPYIIMFALGVILFRKLYIDNKKYSETA